MTRLLSTQRTAMDAPCGAMSRQLSALRSQLSAIRRPSSWQTKTASSSDFSGHGKNEGAAFRPSERRPKSRTPRATEIPKGRSPKGIASCRLRSLVLRPSVGLWLFGLRNISLRRIPSPCGLPHHDPLSLRDSARERPMPPSCFVLPRPENMRAEGPGDLQAKGNALVIGSRPEIIHFSIFNPPSAQRANSSLGPLGRTTER